MARVYTIMSKCVRALACARWFDVCLKNTMHKPSEPASDQANGWMPWRRWRRLDLNANFWKPFLLYVFVPLLFFILKTVYMRAALFSGFCLTFSKNLVGICIICSQACVWKCMRAETAPSLTQSVHSKCICFSFPSILFSDTAKPIHRHIEMIQSFRGHNKEAQTHTGEWDGLNIRWPIFWFDNSTVKRDTFRCMRTHGTHQIKRLTKNWISWRPQLQRPLFMKLDRKRKSNDDDDNDQSKSDQSSKHTHSHALLTQLYIYR